MLVKKEFTILTQGISRCSLHVTVQYWVPRTHPPYPPEYRQQIVELAHVGRSPIELAREFEPSEQTIRDWIKQAEIDAGRRQDGLTTADRHPSRPSTFGTGCRARQGREELNSERFQDEAPRQVYAALLDEGTYLCHWRTMYRVLAEHNEVRERRNQLRHPHYPVAYAYRPSSFGTGLGATL